MNKNVKIALIIGGIILAILIILSFIPGGQNYGYGMMGHGMMGGYATMWFMPIFWIVLLGLAIWAAVALARGVNQPGNTNTSRQTETALEILKRRYAQGEINKEEYEQKKKDLT